MTDWFVTFLAWGKYSFLIYFVCLVLPIENYRSKMNNHITTIAFDADDTLWVNERCFQEA
jgi:hypothetical protein